MFHEMNITIKIIDSTSSGANYNQHQIFVLPVKGEERIGDVKRKILEKISASPKDALVRLIFGGQYLTDDAQSVNGLQLGPSTILNAIITANVTSISEKSQEDEKTDKNEPRQWRSRFFVFCKNKCRRLTPGKLRVRCSTCKSAVVILSKEPNSWNDVLTRGNSKCRCLENRCDDDASTAEFYFKCARCSDEEGVVVLPQVKNVFSNLENCKACSICGSDATDSEDDKNLKMVFSCENILHAACLNCFAAYGTEQLERRAFIMHPVYGYTLPCPEPRCRDGYITDAHHFRLLGSEEMYEKYHRLAAEMYLLGEGGLYCPRPGCGEAFIADAFENKRAIILCPKCAYAFCSRCRFGASACRCDSLNSARSPTDTGTGLENSAGPDEGKTSSEARSYVTIHSTTKACPKCRAPTEKNEGCNHMTCAQCRFDWCWDCETRWTEDCQWNHWFE